MANDAATIAPTSRNALWSRYRLLSKYKRQIPRTKSVAVSSDCRCNTAFVDWTHFETTGEFATNKHGDLLKRFEEKYDFNKKDGIQFQMMDNK